MSQSKRAANEPNILNERKRTKIEGVPKPFEFCQLLLATNPSKPLPLIPESLLAGGKTGLSLEKTLQIFENHGFRTSVVKSPRPALSIYKESCVLDVESDENPMVHGKSFLVGMLGMHPKQSEIERYYLNSFKSIYCLLLFCQRLRLICPRPCEDSKIATMLESFDETCRAQAVSTALDDVHEASTKVAEKVAQLIDAFVAADSRIRPEQLQREFDRFTFQNSSFSNALVQLFLQSHDCVIKDIYFKRSHEAKYERITVYVYNPDIDLLKPPPYTFLPALRKMLDEGPEAVAKDMVQSFWEHLLRLGYFATKAIKADFTPNLTKYFLSGLSRDPTIPIHLNAHFSPNFPLSFYLYGKAGAGKSSLVRNFTPALNATVVDHADPEMLVRFVKQNLNKPYQDLKLELEIRPNNNDLSVMSIIQGRRMTMTQSKPGLVVVDLEEMASNDPNSNPNQLETAQLLSQRFAGRNSEYKKGKKAPRNAGKRGISGDATLIVLFTSNYELEEPCAQALHQIEMFQNLKTVHTKAVAGEDRREFAHTYLQQCVHDRFVGLAPKCRLELNMPFGQGDTRPLVRHLRMLAFYVCALAEEAGALAVVGSEIVAQISQQEGARECTVSSGGKTMHLSVGSFDNLLPREPRIFDKRTASAVGGLSGPNPSSSLSSLDLSQVIDFYFAKTLAPAVVISQNRECISALVKAVGSQESVHSIEGVDPSAYKMMKSLYDPKDTPNLRDDILKFGRGAFVAVELLCASKDSQLCIRELIEDSPSMTAFSTDKSALYKSGLFFAVYVEGEITPEVKSRGSLII